jgi:Domain of unknown function (DUF4375)
MSTLIAGLSGLAAFSVSERTIAAREQPVQNLERLKTLPLIEVVRSGTSKLAVTVTFAPHDARSDLGGNSPLAAIDNLEPELRCLTWLMVFAHGWAVRDENDWLHTFFFMQSGDFAPQVHDALKEAGLTAQYEIFSKAMALFGQNYPVGHKDREVYFAWSKPDRPLNAFDRKLLALSAEFGSRSDYERAVEDYVRNNPKILRWAQDERPKVDDRLRLMWLVLQLYKMVDDPDSAGSKQKLAALPKPCQELVYLDTSWGEIFNGGVEQFFSNTSGDVAPEVVRTLREVGLVKEADVIQRGIDLFPSPYPADRERRSTVLAKDKGRAIDQQLYKLEVDSVAIRRAMIDLAKREGLLPQ